MKRLVYFIGVLLLANLWGLNFSAQAFMPTWTSVSSNLLINQSTNVLIKNGINGWNCGARSQEVLSTGSDGWVEIRFTAYNKSGANCAFGLASTNPDHGFGSMEYAFYITATSASAYASGSLLATSTTAVNDVLRISKSGSTVSFLVNGSAIATRTITTPVNLFVDMGIRNHSCYMQGLVCSFGSYQSHAWNSLNAMSESGGQLTRSGTSAASAYSKNFLPPSQTGFIEYTNLTSHLHGANWYWGFSTTQGAYSTWPYAVRINANSDSAAFYCKGSLLTSFVISNNDILRLDYVGDRVVLSQNNTVKSDQNHFVAVPLVFSLSSPGTSGNAIYNADFSMSFASTNQYLHVTTTEVDGDNPATATLTDFGFGSGTKESLWADDFVTRSEWDAEWAALDPEIRQLLDTLPYDDVFATKSMTLAFSEPGDAKVWFHQLSPDVVVSTDYKIANRSDVKTNTGYVFTDNVISKSTTSTGRFLLENGSIPGATDGEISFQIFQASATLRVGFSAIGSTASSNGSHMSHYFSVNAGNVFPVVNGTGITTNRAYGLGDILTIRITGASMQFLINSTVIHTATLAGTENLQVEIFYINNPTANKTYVKVLQNTYANIFQGKKKLYVNVTHLNCDGSGTGSATLSYVPKNWINPTFNLRNAATNALVYTGSNSSWTGLGPGSYELEISTTSLVFYFKIGYEIDWEYTSAYLAESGTANMRMLSHSNANSNDIATSKNQLYPGQTGWISWEYRNLGPTGSMKNVSVILHSDDVESDNARVIFYPSSFAVFGVQGTTCMNSLGFPLNNYHTRCEIDWDQTNATFIMNGIALSNVCNIPIGQDQRFLKTIFNGTTSAIKNAAASFPCTSLKYATLKKEMDAAKYCTFGEVLYFKYDNQYIASTNEALTFNIYDERHEVAVDNTDLSAIPLILGHNEHALDLTSFNLDDDQTYLLEVINDKKEKFYLRFKVL